VQELTLVEKEWIVSHENLKIAPKAKMFSPGNLRATTENKQYGEVVAGWIGRGLTLRYTGGLVPDVVQMFIKGNGVLSNIASASHKCKLRALYEAGAVGWLVEKAGGRSVSTGGLSLMDICVGGYDDRL
jgi:sedoheptulose-bisphosphatase